MKRFGIITKKQNPAALQLGKELIAWLKSRQCQPLPDKNLAQSMGKKFLPDQEIVKKSDLIITLGGDGTFLYASSLPENRPVPILGVNLGGLGFLTEVSPDELFPLLEEILNGKIQIEKRTRIQCTCLHQGKSLQLGNALNDCVIKGSDPDHLTLFSVVINQGTINNYRADGIIIATPTGSTAYNLSVGGPIVHPLTNAFIIAPISPHTLTQRPIVIPDTARIRIIFPRQKKAPLLSLDGQKRWKIASPDIVEIDKAPVPTLLVRPPQREYFQLLNAKLRWGFS